MKAADFSAPTANPVPTKQSRRPYRAEPVGADDAPGDSILDLPALSSRQGWPRRVRGLAPNVWRQIQQDPASGPLEQQKREFLRRMSVHEDRHNLSAFERVRRLAWWYLAAGFMFGLSTWPVRQASLPQSIMLGWVLGCGPVSWLFFYRIAKAPDRDADRREVLVIDRSGSICLALVLLCLGFQGGYALVHSALVSWGIAAEAWVDPDEGPDDYRATT